MLLKKNENAKSLLQEDKKLNRRLIGKVKINSDYQIILISWIASLIWTGAAIGIATLVSPLFLVVMVLVPFGIFMLSPLAGIVSYLTILIWQNTVIGIWSPYLAEGQMSILQGTNFLVCALFGGYCFIRLMFSANDLGPFANRTLKIAFIFLILAVLYLLYGAAVNKVFVAVAYFRNFTGGILCLAIGTYLSQHVRLNTFVKIWMFLGGIILLQACMEFFFTRFYYGVLNLHHLYAIKFDTGKADLDGTIEALRTTFFNSPYFNDLGITSFRILGPTFHAISFGYLLSFCALVFFIARKYALVFIAIVFILIIGTKGPSIMTIFSIGLVCLTRMGTGRGTVVRISTLVCTLLTPLIFLYGYSVRDYHVLGLIGGVRDFLSFPVGRGFGFGGNLAAIDSKPWWLQAQLRGYTPFGLESSVSVLLNQWGIFGFAYMAFLFSLWRSLSKSFREHGAKYTEDYDFSIFYFAYGFILVNFFFQEEVLSPYGLGIEFLWIGFLLKYAGQFSGGNPQTEKNNPLQKKRDIREMFVS
ncbi:MAG TPA: hypothetical protein PKH37_06720 [Alphaproteobacteria bacterium]|nr:hypothetical protein [Alphaproteobacteria bacterium]